MYQYQDMIDSRIKHKKLNWVTLSIKSNRKTDRLVTRMLLCQRIFIVCASFKRYVIRLAHTYLCAYVDVNS